MNEPQAKLSNRSLTARLLVFAVGMFAFGFLVLPPLYSVFCDITGFGSRSSTTAQLAVEQPDLARTVRIEFVTTVNEYAPWSFTADVDSMEVHPGKMYFATFSATNRADSEMTGQAVPSIAPLAANEHFKKIECFCFEQQELIAGGELEMGVSFYVDAELPTDISQLTLSYTMFNIGEVEHEHVASHHE
jgi:cytochrome c oxidase assembly protein subunit 11